MTVAAATRVTVRFFASLREVAGVEALALEIDEASLAGVRAKLATLLSAAQCGAIGGDGVQVAVNQVIVQGEARLETGDEVAFLPPVTGG